MWQLCESQVGLHGHLSVRLTAWVGCRALECLRILISGKTDRQRKGEREKGGGEKAFALEWKQIFSEQGRSLLHHPHLPGTDTHGSEQTDLQRCGGLSLQGCCSVVLSPRHQCSVFRNITICVELFFLTNNYVALVEYHWCTLLPTQNQTLKS